MQIWTMGWEHAPNLTADVTIVGVGHGRGVLQYAFLSTEILKIKTSESSMTKDRYGKCSKISNTLKLRTPKIIAENNF